jgi:hypothetical protein
MVLALISLVISRKSTILERKKNICGSSLEIPFDSDFFVYQLVFVDSGIMHL